MDRQDTAADAWLAGHYDWIRNHVARILEQVGQREDVDDAAQDCMVRIWRHWPRLPSHAEDDLQRWATRVARNAALDAYRRRRARYRVEARYAAALPAPEAPDVLALVVQRERVRLAWHALRDYERAIAWHAACGYDYRLIARELGLPLGTVKTRVRYWRQRLATGQADLGLQAADAPPPRRWPVPLT